jgi:hypothetical protein
LVSKFGGPWSAGIGGNRRKEDVSLRRANIDGLETLTAERMLRMSRLRAPVVELTLCREVPSFEYAVERVQKVACQ